MVTELKDSILEFLPDTIEYVRKEVNLEKEGRIEEAVDILDDWVKKQRHFVKKDFSRKYLEWTLITAKGLVERAKLRIDKLCTFKTLMPEVYPGTVSKKEYEALFSCGIHAHLPRMTKEHYRAYIFNVKSEELESSDFQTFFKYLVVCFEYLKRSDYNSGYIVVLDVRNANILNIVAKLTPMLIRQLVSVTTEGYGMRLKQIHVITGSKMVDVLLAAIQPMLSAKLAERIHLHKNLDTLYDFVPKDVLPEDYGGTERSLQKLNEEWLNAITTQGFVEYFEEMCQAKTDESCRPADKFNDQCLGMPGSFRALSVD